MADDRVTRREWLALALAAIIFVALSGIGITYFPLPWWDEGWTLSVAKNWVTAGHYGHLLNGTPTGPSLSAHLPVVAIVAAAFKVFGVGLAQARMAIIVCAAIVLVLLYVLTRRLCSRNAAVLALLLVTVIPTQWDLSMLFLARNVLGEVPSIMFILLGLVLLLQSKGEHVGWLAGAGLILGIALATKAQVVPFVLFALAVMTLQLFIHDRRLAVRLLGVLIIALLTMNGVGVLRRLLLTTPGMPVDPIAGIADVTGMVFDREIREQTLRFAVMTGLSTTVALAVNVFQVGVQFRRANPPTWPHVVRSVLTLIAASWFGWYVLFSIGWGRYGFPSFVIAAPFVAELLLWLFAFVRASGSGVRPARQPGRLVAIGLLVFFLMMAGRQLWFGVRALGQPIPVSGLEAVTEYLNRSTPPGTTIETYDSEVLFLLDRPVHFPPAQVNVEFLRRNYLKGTTALGYELERIDAEYLLVGAFSRGFYAPLIERGLYVSDRRFGEYELYRRVRGPR